MSNELKTTDPSKFDKYDLMTLAHRFRVYVHEDGKVSMYYVHSDRGGYNRRDITISLMRGPALTSAQLCDIMGGSPYCGGISPNNIKAEDARLFEPFSAVVWGCD